MPVETAADLAGMFDEDEFAESASYVGPAGGAGIPCSVIVDRGQGRRRFEGGNTATVGRELHIWARHSELPGAARGGVFTMLDAAGDPTGEIFTIAGLPQLDLGGALWSIELTA